MYEVIILSIVQGITEFLPISSSAHLIFISNFFEFKLNSLILDISLHSGSLAAILIYFKKDIINLKKNIIYFFNIILSSIPVIVVGYLIVKFNIITLLRDVKIIAIMTIIFAFFLFYSDNQTKKNKFQKNFDLKFLIIIGIFQVLSLIPGVSRSGITISIARLLNFNRSDAAKISFFLSIPILGTITIYNLYILSKLNNLDLSKINFLAFALSFLFSYITIKYFLDFIKKNNFNFFVIYRILLGIVILLYLK